jgi:hypothetical protein
MAANKQERSRMWETAKLLQTGMARDRKFFGHYALYATLVGQFDRGELTNEQKTVMGINAVEIVATKGSKAPQKGSLIIDGRI